jgi:hypothetical protein
MRIHAAGGAVHHRPLPDGTDLDKIWQALHAVT